MEVLHSVIMSLLGSGGVALCDYVIDRYWGVTLCDYVIAQ